MNYEMHQAALKALLDKGVPVSTAQRAAAVAAKDDPNLPNLGRTKQDQKDIQDAVTWIWAKIRGS